MLAPVVQIEQGELSAIRNDPARSPLSGSAAKAPHPEGVKVVAF
jgi:hypothetical protein